MSDPSQTYFVADDIASVKRKALSGSVHTGLGQALRIGVSFVSQLFLGRLLTPSDFGLVAMTGVFMALADLFGNLGVAQAVIQKHEITHEDLSFLYWVGLLASVVVALLLIAASPLVAWFYHEPRVLPVMVVLAFQLPISAVAGHMSALMSRKMRFGTIAVIDLFSAATVTLVSIASAWAGAGYWSLVFGSLAGILMKAGLDVALCGWRPSAPRWTGTALPMLRFGRDMTAFNFITFVSSYLDNLLIGVVHDARDVGLFDRSFTLVIRPLGSLTAPVGRVAVPLLSRLLPQPAEYRASFLLLFDALQVLLLPGLVVAAVLPRDVVGVLLGANWLVIAPMFSAISIAACFVPLSSAGTWLLTSQGRIAGQVKASLIGSGAVVVSLLIGLHWGIVGVSVAYAIFAPLVHGVYAYVASRHGPVRGSDILAACVPGLAAAAVSAMGLTQLERVIQAPSGRCVVAGFLSYGISVAVFLTVPRCRNAGIAAARALLRRGRPPVRAEA